MHNLADSRCPCNSRQFLDNLTGTPPVDASERFSHMSSAALWHELIVICLRRALDTRRDRRIRKELRSRGCPV